jgi:D-xylulose reductase
MGKPMTSFPTLELSAKELDVRGSLRYTTGCFEDASDLLERKLVDLKPLITRTFPLAQSEEAFKAVRAGSEIKIVVMNQE